MYFLKKKIKKLIVYGCHGNISRDIIGDFKVKYRDQFSMALRTTISFKSLGTDATKPLNFNKRQSPRPLFNVVSHFSSGLMCFGWSNIDWGGGRGRGAVLYVK
jgi:hypothetical protein